MGSSSHVSTRRHTHPNEYLSHEIGEEEHIAEESCPSQQVTDAQAAVVVWHVDESSHQRPECHPLLGLQIHARTSQVDSTNADKIKK